MLVIIEGPDRTGKSTLARLLSEETGVRYVHRGPPGPHPLKEYGSDLQVATDSTYKSFGSDGRWIGIVDRWHLGERVYPRLYPEARTPLRQDARLWIDMLLRGHGAVLVGADGDPDRIRAEIEAEEDSYLKAEDVDTCIGFFQSEFHQSLLPAVRWSIDDEGGVTADELVRAAGYAKFETRFMNNFHLVGAPSPRVLLVGEQRNTDWTDYPFAPEPGGSGRYLLSALWDTWSVADLRDLTLVNALAPDGQPIDLQLVWRLLGRPATVALGKVADAHLDQWEVPHGAVPHPQYVRRFHHSTLREYGLAVAVAASNQADMTPLWRDR